MAPRQRFLTAKDLPHEVAQSPRRDDAAKDASSTAADRVKFSDTDQIATKDEVRAAGERASARWAGLLHRLAE